MSTPPDRSPRERLFDAAGRWGTVWMVGLLLVCFWSLIVWLAGLQRERSLAEGFHDLSARAEAVAQRTGIVFREAETDLRITERWLQAHPEADPLTDPVFRGLLDEMRLASRGLVDLRLATAEGKVFAFPAPGGPASPLAGAPLRLDPEARPQTLQIGAPSRDDRGWQLPVAWRLNLAVGPVLVLSGRIDLEALSRTEDAARFRPDGEIVLMRRDGLVLSRAPFDAARIASNLGATPEFAAEFGVRDRGSFFSDAAATPRLMSYERLADQPISVLATRDLQGALGDFEARRRLVFGLCAALTLVALGIAVWLQHLRHELDHAQQELERMARLDPLTDIMNRRALTESASREFGRARRTRSPAAVLAMDIDHFKRVNDTHGHAAGDHVLRECAQRWKASLRAHDLLGRMGGEEFCVVLPDTPPDGVTTVAERLRAAVCEPPLEGVAQVTVSVGLSYWREGDEDWSIALARADKALYEAKSSGRDRVCVAAGDPPPAADEPVEPASPAVDLPMIGAGFSAPSRT